ncbi:WWE protein-protein interaction domain protein family [Artemisia annua]|uniref:WWE protein-protein interaction domain protein family n=1 Tax=Artemisia annua TaxID=35608 RepID=A0A2U1QJV4_ARTAN|nr:WWE protein-protein interaction domain protein family [Artemisia annua]
MQPQRCSKRLSKAKQSNTSEEQQEEKRKTRMNSESKDAEKAMTILELPDKRARCYSLCGYSYNGRCAEGIPDAEDCKVVTSRVTHSEVHLQEKRYYSFMENCPQVEEMNMSPLKKSPSVGSSTLREPKSPWMSFSKLFANLGNVELIQSGSKQFYRINTCFDSGVDDLQTPNNYVIWNMNMNTHIFPERVGYQMLKIARWSRQELPHSEVNLQAKRGKLPSNGRDERVTFKKGPSVGSSTLREPKSPWMSFSKLFEAVPDEVAPNDMRLLHVFNKSFRVSNLFNLYTVLCKNLTSLTHVIQVVLYRDADSISLSIEAYEQCLKINPDSPTVGQPSELQVK